MLPNPARAVVDPAKVRDYLLSPEHPVGRFKAVVFFAAGFRRDDWPALKAQLLATARTEARLLAPSPFGQKYEVVAMLEGPGGRGLAVRVIWLVRRGEDFPRLVTAYPGVAQ